MTETKARWRWITTNRLLSCCNIILFLALAPQWLRPFDAATLRGRRDAKALDMELYFAKGPFTILRGRSNDSFQVFYYPEGLVVMKGDASDRSERGAEKEAIIALGPDFSVTCRYSLGRPDRAVRPEVRELLFTRYDDGFFDLNADGFFDERVLHKAAPDPTIVQVWCKGEWRDVVPDENGSSGDRYRKRLRDFGAVVFNMNVGAWLPEADARAVGRARTD